MKIGFKYLLLLTLGLIQLGSLSQTTEENFQILTEDHGLSGGVITCMLKDSQGFMWFGTQNGLNKFDGYDFSVYRHIDTLSNPFAVKCMKL